jgi:hypothetical protein
MTANKTDRQLLVERLCELVSKVAIELDPERLHTVDCFCRPGCDTAFFTHEEFAVKKVEELVGEWLAWRLARGTRSEASK